MKKSWKSFMTVTAAAAAMTAAMAFSSLAAVAKVGTQEFNREYQHAVKMRTLHGGKRHMDVPLMNRVERAA